MHVPLIIRAPGVFPAGKVVHADVEMMDVYATLLELAGIKPRPERSQGTTLVPLALRRGRQQPARRADRRRPGGARAQGRSATAWCTAAPGASSSTTSSTIRASRRTSPPTARSRCGRCAACSGCCTRTRHLVEVALGNRRQPLSQFPTQFPKRWKRGRKRRWLRIKIEFERFRKHEKEYLTFQGSFWELAIHSDKGGYLPCI